MPSLTHKQKVGSVKCLLIGDSGSGKTGALGSLVKMAGQKLRILDYDNGCDILLNETVIPANLRPNVEIETCTDKLKAASGITIPDGKPEGFAGSMSLLNNWKPSKLHPDAADLGPVTSWGVDTTLVIDSLTFAGQAAFRYVLYMAGRSMDSPHQADWGQAMKMQEGLLELLYSDSVKCNVIMTSHLTLIGGDEKTGSGGEWYPMALGKKLPPKIGRYFNTMLLVGTRGTGNGLKRMIQTRPTTRGAVKCPWEVEKELPLSTGLADIYQAAGIPVVTP